jgi:hypothetical protein
MLVRQPITGAFNPHIIAMHRRFNPLLQTRLALTALLWGVSMHALGQSAGLPIIVPEAVFANLGRVTGGTTQQRIMDRGSIIRIKLADDQERIAPDTEVVLFRQGLRLRNADRTLGVLAVPVGRGRTLQRLTENQEIADPNEPGVAWVRIQSVRQEVSRGDSLMTASAAQQWGANNCEETPRTEAVQKDPTPTNPADARVIGLVSSDVLADPMSASLDLVVMDGGCQSGYRNGQAVSLWRPPVISYGRKLDQPVDTRDNNSSSVIDDNPGISRTQIPGHRIGSGVVVAAYADSALVRIRVATQPVQVDDQVRPMRLRNQP